jgi:tRNA A-37 threonylcarbamoyl transferase component Bud32
MLTSTHFTHAEELFASFECGYRSSMGTEADETLSRMRQIDRRGRYVDREDRVDRDR